MAGPQPATASAISSPVAAAVISSPGATPAEIHGLPANPAHGQYTWEDPQWMPWQVVPGVTADAPGVAEQLLADAPPSAPAGSDPDGYADPTATLSHGAPWPHARVPNIGAVNDIEATAAQAAANAQLHSLDSGDPAAFTLQPVSTHVEEWDRMGYTSPGTSGLEPPNAQMTGNGMTGFRRDSGFTVPGENLNRFGMDSAHVSRYRATGDIPVPPNSTQGAQRPLTIHPASARSYPVGAGSPFEGQVPGYGADYSVGYTGLASDYQASPDPLTGPPLATQQPPGQPVWGFDLYG